MLIKLLGSRIVTPCVIASKIKLIVNVNPIDALASAWVTLTVSDGLILTVAIRSPILGSGPRPGTWGSRDQRLNFVASHHLPGTTVAEPAVLYLPRSYVGCPT